MDIKTKSNAKTTKKIRYNHVGQKLQRQEEFRKMVNSTEQMAFIFITTHSFNNKTISSLFLITNNLIYYYVNGHSLPQFYNSALSFENMKELITQTFKQKSIFVYENSGFTIKAIQKHFHIDDQIIKQSKIQNILTKMRSLFSNQQVQNYSRQTIIKFLGLGFNQLNKIEPKSIPQIWNRRYDSLEFVNIILAWGMNQILSIKYMAYYAIYQFKKLKMEQQPQSFQRLEELKKENQHLLLKFMNEDLKIQQPEHFFQNMII